MKGLTRARHLFTAFLLAWFIYGVWEAQNYSYLAKIFPFYVSLILVISTCVAVIWEIRKIVTRAENLKEDSEEQFELNWDMPISTVWRRFGFYLATIVVLYIAIYVIGYPVAIAVFILIFYRVVVKASWLATILATLGGFGFLCLASEVLGMEWPKGMIEFPWPLG